MLEIPSYLDDYLKSNALNRLKNIDMNCGVNYTNLPLFSDIDPYTRYDHSLRVACIIDYFTHDKKQVLSGLFHDIATPAFSHTIDFMNGDYLHQESTESYTKELIQNDPIISEQLLKEQISIDEVYDYHIYPVADNDSPKLSADRLEYTLSNSLNYGFSTKQELSDIFDDIIIGKNEYYEDEMMFLHQGQAERFAELALRCGKVYSSKEDRFAMEMLSDIIKEFIDEKILKYSDLYTDEIYVINKIKNYDSWIKYTKLSSVDYAEDGIIIHAKKRYIDPFVLGLGRISQFSDKMNSEIESFLNESQDERLIGVYENGR